MAVPWKCRFCGKTKPNHYSNCPIVKRARRFHRHGHQ